MANKYYNSSPSYVWPHHSSLSQAPSHHSSQQLPIFWHSLQTQGMFLKNLIFKERQSLLPLNWHVILKFRFFCVLFNIHVYNLSLVKTQKTKMILDLLWVPIVSLDLSNSIWFCNLNFWFSNSSLFLALSCCDLNSLSSNCLKGEETIYVTNKKNTNTSPPSKLLTDMQILTGE